MAADSERFVYVSEDAIAFWGCMFPIDRLPEHTHYLEYTGRPLKVLAFSFSDIPQSVRFAETEVVFDERNLKLWGDRYKNYDKKAGYQFVWYTHMPHLPPSDLSVIHSILIFSRCFLLPKTPARAELHASRLQHLFGVRGVGLREVRRMLHNREAAGYSFSDVVLKLKSIGVHTLPVDFLRMWVAKAYEVHKVLSLMELGAADNVPRRCGFCLIASSEVFLSTIKMGANWYEILILINDAGLHISAQEAAENAQVNGQFVNMGTTHAIQYGINNSLEIFPLTYARCLQWTHRYLRNLILGVDQDDEVSHDYVRQMLTLSVQNHVWTAEEYAPLHHILWVLERGLDGIAIDRQRVMKHFSAFVQFIENPNDVGGYEIAEACQRLRALAQ